MSSGKQPIVKVSDVAKAAGVSATAVYSLLNGRYYGSDSTSRIGLSEETRERIRLACREVKYVPDDPATRIRVQPELGGFLMMLCDEVRDQIANPYFSPILQGLSAHAAKDRRGCSFCSFGLGTDYMVDPDQLPDAVRGGFVNKVVIAGAINYSLLLALDRAACRIVYASRVVGLPSVHAVAPDYRAAASAAMAHFAELGHRTIAVAIPSFVKEDAFYFRELTAGCREAWAALGGADPGPTLVHDRRPADSPLDFFDWIQSELPGVTAIFSFDDATAISLLNSASRAGVGVPEDVSIIGCNDELRPYSPLPLTTVHFPILEMGRRAGELLDRAVAGHLESEQPTIEVLPVELRIRATTAICRTSSPTADPPFSRIGSEDGANGKEAHRAK